LVDGSANRRSGAGPDPVTAFVDKATLWMRAHQPALSVVTALVVAALAFMALHHLAADVHLHQVRASLHALQPWQAFAALGFTAASYSLLTLYDVLALRVIGRPLPYRTAALASFTSYTLSHNLGLALLTGGSARFRVYSAAGLSAGDIARVVATASLTFWSGVFVMAGIALMLHPLSLSIAGIALPVVLQNGIGIAIVTSAAGLIMFAGRGHRALHLFRWRLPLPSARQGLAQIGVAALDLAAASAALFVLLPNVAPTLFPLFFLGYALAIVVALVSHVPGGIGVFEAVMIAALPSVNPADLLSALIMYRVIYYLVPLFIAAIVLAYHERRYWQKPLFGALDVMHAVVAGVAPMLLAALAFVGGSILLVSGALPAVPARLGFMRHIVPLPFVEASHIAASLAGTGLLLLAPGLYRRLDGAFLLTRALLVAGIIFSLTKGFDFEEAAVLLVIAAILQSMRSQFYRHTALTATTLSPAWLAAVTIAVGLSVWIGFFVFKHVDYQTSLWWQFAWRGNASRFLRASFAAAIVIIGVTVMRMFGAAEPRNQDWSPEPAPQDAVFEQCERTDAMLALTGDKRFLAADDGTAFLMYQVQGHSWIVMGDPVGPRHHWPDLLWQLRERADAAQGRLLLYQITPAALPIAIDMGLQLVKYGEEARVDLSRFTLDGPDAKPLRYAERRALRDGAEFAIIPAEKVPLMIGELRAVSDAWLASKSGFEKAFSIGRFDPAYLARFDCAVVLREGKIVAFANIWATLNHEEASVDLMRHVDDMPYGTMDFLFVRLMVWAQERGYRWFTLGLAPLSGVEARRLSPIWARAGAFLYRHGEAIYGFEGLRAYKAKFSPVWEPRYIAGPTGVGLARALIDLQTLVGGGRTSAARQRPIAQAA
jgi:phosphatidylglycerol lysyltransferase